ncbi:MAG: hypothetical protein JWN52_7214 [Actinomycetia bacterium]|nr:hypothetical protein [Actinomycetes bacterium]
MEGSLIMSEQPGYTPGTGTQAHAHGRPLVHLVYDGLIVCAVSVGAWLVLVLAGVSGVGAVYLTGLAWLATAAQHGLVKAWRRARSRGGR